MLLTVVEWSVTRGAHGPRALVLLPPLILIAVGYLVIRLFISGLMDEVWDNGDELIVLNDGHAEHIPLSNIINVSYVGFSNPARATLTLRRPCRWGEKFTFSPRRKPLSFRDVMDNPLIDDLIRRVDEARRRA